MAKCRDVVVTGFGVVAPNGIGNVAFWQSLLAAQSGIDTITLFDASAYASRIAGEVKNFDLTAFHKPKTPLKRLARQTQLALAAAKLAMRDARIEGCRLGWPLFLGTSTSAIDIVELGMERLNSHGPTRVPAHIVSSGHPQHAATAITEELEGFSESHTVASACAAGLEAVAYACDMIRRGAVDIALAGGTDAPITPLTFACLDKCGLVSRRNEEPHRASRPFDRDRDTGVVSEGAAMLVLENIDHALGRGMTPYLAITGFGSFADPDLDTPGSGLETSMRQALANAGKRPDQIDFICAHGPGHPILDRVETEMIKRVFGPFAYRVPVSSIKGVIGNPLSAAGPMQLAACAFTVRDGQIPPTANLDNADPDCDLDYVAGAPRAATVDCALLNVHGLGNGNTSMIVERADGAPPLSLLPI